MAFTYSRKAYKEDEEFAEIVEETLSLASSREPPIRLISNKEEN